MPWRQTRDPYRIWLSEVMLQQTQVATVIPYYERFLAKFPTVHELAAAPLDDVLKLWAGLGYYSRARNLHRGAQVIAGRFGGTMPETAELIREVPGIGEYTAGAVLSIAYGKAEPLVDGNVIRVLSRVNLLEGDGRKGEARRVVWDAARELVSASPNAGANPGDLNQGLMELGATICTPRSPQCLLCPVATFCAAREKGLQQSYPKMEKRAASPVWHLRAWAVADERGQLLFAQRAACGLFAGLWEMPMEKVSAPVAAREKPLGNVTHTLTHRVLEIHILPTTKSEWKPGALAPSEFPAWSGEYTRFEWVVPSKVTESLAVASVQHALLQEWDRHIDSGKKHGNSRRA